MLPAAAPLIRHRLEADRIGTDDQLRHAAPAEMHHVRTPLLDVRTPSVNEFVSIPSATTIVFHGVPLTAIALNLQAYVGQQPVEPRRAHSRVAGKVVRKPPKSMIVADEALLETPREQAPSTASALPWLIHRTRPLTCRANDGVTHAHPFDY